MEYLIRLLIEPLIMFFVVLAAVRIGISPMLTDHRFLGFFKVDHISKMKVMGVLNDEMIRKYHELNVQESRLGRDVLDYRHFREVLERLKDAELLSDMEFEKKMIKLNKYYSFE